MQSNLTQIQYQQLQIQQQQQRLAQMMQQKQQQQQRYANPLPPPPPPPQPQTDLIKQQQLLQMQQQQQRFMYQQPMRASPVSSSSFPPPPLPLHAASINPMTMPPPPSIPFTQQQPRPQPPQPPSQIIPLKTETQKKMVALYTARDEAYQIILNEQQRRHVELAKSKKKSLEMAGLEKRARLQNGPVTLFGTGYKGYYGNHKTGTKNRVRYIQPPFSSKSSSSSNSTSKKRRTEFRFPMEAMNEQAEKQDTLVPIRIDLEHEGYKLRDTFTWNLNESLITPEQFADIMCEDLKLPHTIFMDQIAKAIKDQIDDYNLNASSIVNEEQEESIEQKNQTLLTLSQEPPLNMTCTSTSTSTNNKKGIELRTIIKLDITAGNRELVDQFEWDISCPKNSPEEFATILTTELGLGGEFKTAIAHSIREQIHIYIKSLLLVGYEFTPTSTIDDEIRHSFLPRLKSIFRRDVDRFTPRITELSDLAIEKMEKDRMREVRRKKRGTRARRGIVLPDREAQKTHRTGFAPPPPSLIENGGEMTEEQLLLMQQQQQGGSGKRSAALKARLNIAAEAATTEDSFMNGLHGGGGGGGGGNMMMIHPSAMNNNRQQNWQQQHQQQQSNVTSSFQQYHHHHHT